MAIWERRWKTPTGHERVAWIVEYKDGNGTRRTKQFPISQKKAAEDWAAKTRIAVNNGEFIADSQSITVSEAGDLWLKTGEAEGLERTTLDQRRQHLKHHPSPFIGALKLTRLNTPTVRNLEDRLREAGRSPKLIRYIVRSLGSMLADAQERGLVGRNVVRELRRTRKRGGEKPRNGKLKVGEDIPLPQEVRALLAAAKGRWRPFLLVAVFCGLRASELRGLRWQDADFAKGELHVRQRANRYNELGPPKTAAGERTVPVPPSALLELKEWKLRCPKGKLGLVFPNGKGHAEFHGNIIRRGLWSTLIRAGVTVLVRAKDGKPVVDDEGKPLVKAKYTGLHALRHFYASWSINCKTDGGLELPPKTVQERMGHSSIVVTMDVYGHLFPRGDDGSELAAGEATLLGLGPRLPA